MNKITQLSEKCIGVTVPEDATDFKTHELAGIEKLVFSSKIQDPLKCGGDMLHIPPGNWQILGLGSALTEEQWKGVVESGRYYDGDPPGLGLVTYYRDYPNEIEESFILEATESGLSLLAFNKLDPHSTLIIVNNE